MTKSRSKDCILFLKAMLRFYYWIPGTPGEIYVLHLAEPKLKDYILDYNWTPKPTKPQGLLSNKQFTNF